MGKRKKEKNKRYNKENNGRKKRIKNRNERIEKEKGKEKKQN